MKITPQRNAKGEFDYGHAWRYYQMGFTDIYGNKRALPTDGEWRVLSIKIKEELWDAKESSVAPL